MVSPVSSRGRPANAAFNPPRNVAHIRRPPVIVFRHIGVHASFPRSRRGSDRSSNSSNRRVDSGIVDPIRWLSLKLVGNRPDQPIHRLPALWESDLNLPRGGVAGLRVEVVGDRLREPVSSVTESPSLGQVNSVWVFASVAVAGMFVECPEGVAHLLGEEVFGIREHLHFCVLRVKSSRELGV